MQLDHTTRHKSCHLLRLICVSIDAQSPPTKTRSLCARKRKGKKISQKRIPRECCCWPTCRLRSTRSTTSADRCITSIQVATESYHKAQVLPPASADLHVVRRAIPTNRNAFALREKEKKGKIKFLTKNSPRPVVTRRIVVCDRCEAQQAQIVA